MVEETLLARIDEANLPEVLAAALKDVGKTIKQLWLGLTAIQQRRLSYMFERVVEEALDSTVQTHWYELELDLARKAMLEQGEAGKPVLEAISDLLPVLRAWLESDDEVSLQEITAETVSGICRLSDTLTEPKKNYVAANAFSLAQAHFNKYAWFRAIYAGRAPVGFVMIVDDTDEEEYFLWRFMIAEPYHGRGYGRKAICRLVEYVQTRPGAKELLVSCVQGEGSPEGFYMKLGFVHTGGKIGDEVVLRLAL